MANGDDKYNSGGFKEGEGSGGGIFSNPGGDPGSVSDYDTWDWKQIEANIVGMSAGARDAANLDRAAQTANPQSLMDAAHAFYVVQLTLEMVAESLTAQTKALAGSDGPWKGDAADAFFDTMTGFSRSVAANADVLSGGASGSHAVPQQIANNAVSLRSAQQIILEIDSFYADQAAAHYGLGPDSHGNIPVSKAGKLAEMMTADMRKVLKSLAHNYQVTVDNLKAPTSTAGPGAPGGLNDPPPLDQPPPPDLANPDAGLGPVVPPGQRSPGTHFPGGTDVANPDAGLGPVVPPGLESPGTHFPGGTDVANPDAGLGPVVPPGPGSPG
ncbi:WXG100 family type VII secretion target, partial [Streptomyces sp. NPDC002523]